MASNDEIFELMTKMHSEMTSMKSNMTDMKSDISNLNKNRQKFFIS